MKRAASVVEEWAILHLVPIRNRSSKHDSSYVQQY
jgi:hypothetical protein